jgi:hypothetical protein
MGAAFARQPGAFWWAAGSAVFMAVGSFGPWARALFINVSGLEGDGVITLAIAVAAAAALWRYAATGNPAFLIAITAGAVVAAAIGIYDATEIESQSSIDFFGEQLELASVGWGLYLMIAASISLAIAALALYWRHRAPAGRG